MLRTDQGALRFTQKEIDDFRAIGIDAADLRTGDDFASVMQDWLDILASERPELFDKIT